MFSQLQGAHNAVAGNMAKNTTGEQYSAVPAPQSVFDAAVMEVTGLANLGEEAAARLEAIANRIFGPEPTAANGPDRGAQGVGVNSKIMELGLTVEDAKRPLFRLLSTIGRLEKL